MKNQCQNVQVVSTNPESLSIRFTETGIVMPISKEVFKERVSAGFYQVAG